MNCSATDWCPPSPHAASFCSARARGTAQPDSDYDILVVAETDLPLEGRVFQARRAVRDVRVAKDIVVVTPDEFRKYSTWLTGVVRDAMEHGEVLYEAA